MTGPTPRALVAGLLVAHQLQGDTAQQYDAAGQCTCGVTFYETGGDPAAFLDAHRRLLAAHAAHTADAVLGSPAVDALVAARTETLAARLTAADMVAAVADALGAEQSVARVEHRRRVGSAGRRALARRALDVVCTELGLPDSLDALLTDPARGADTATGPGRTAR